MADESPLPATPEQAAPARLGLKALAAGRHAEAVGHLEEAAALDPDQPALRHHLASCLQALGRHAEAAAQFRAVVRLRPEVAEARNNLGIALARTGDRDGAAAEFGHALRLRPEFPEALNNLGIAAVEAGRADEALGHFRAALSLHPGYAEAHNNLGTALARLGRRGEAAEAFAEALRLKPDYADAAMSLGNLRRDGGDHAGAAESYRAAAAARPGHREALVRLAVALSKLGDAEGAVAALHQALLFHPEEPETYNHLGVVLSQHDRLAEAAAAFGNALRLRPDDPEALNNLGNTLLRQQKGDEAVALFRRAIDARKGYPQPHCNLGSALLQQGDAAGAVGHYEEALRLDPGYHDARFNLGNALRALGRLDEAAACYEAVLSAQPDNHGARLNLGVARSEQGRLDEAVGHFEEVLRRKPDYAPAFNSLGVARLHQGRHAEALAQFEGGLRLMPDDAETRLNRALTLLQAGDLAAGWDEYEWRWKLKKAANRPHPQPEWDGSPLPGGTILLWSEQGLGDTLQFARYAAAVKGLVGRVLLDCPGPLRGLLATCPGVDALAGGGAEPARADVQAPLMGLPRLLGTTVPTIPAAVPYLFADAAARDRWRARVGAGGLRVGVVWQGNPQFAGDRHRSVPLTRFRPLADVPGVRLFSLQKGKAADQLADAGFPIEDLGAEITGDFRDTAAAILSLDLVVAVDTSVAHLAGALGVPLWVLLPFNPDWRWLLGREDSPWYPTARLFRQASWGDWDGVFARIAGALAGEAGRPRTRTANVPLGLAELFERAAAGGPGSSECRAALREAGVPDTEGLGRLSAELRAARAAMDAATAEMLAPAPDARAATLVRRYAEARRKRDDALARFDGLAAGG